MANNIELLTQERQDENIATLKAGDSLSKIIMREKERQLSCQDHIVDTKNMWVGDDLDLVITDNYRYSMSQHSFSQLCTKYDVPVRYMKSCIKKGESDLVHANLNTWIGKSPNKQLLVRTYNDSVRGILSDKYSVMDTPDILQVVDDATNGIFEVKSSMINEERLHLRMIGEKMNVPNEDLFTGIQVDSSDVGRKLLEVKFFVYKQVCTNGLVVPIQGSTLYSQKHIGITPEEFRMEFKKNIDLIPQVASEVEGIIISNTKSKMVSDKNYKDLIEKVIADLKLPKDIDNKIIELTPKYGYKNKWSLVNALTEIAQDYSLERRLEIEKYAGKLLVA